ncbi:MAG: alkaline phosphatase family protein [Alphaproteobacteria bacterium]|nr:alkaline phosphatase family protein [Alphaproteobacteria bacterium]
MFRRARPSPRLVLQITVGGLRGDSLRRYGDRFGGGGLRDQRDHGAVYTDAQSRHANTQTLVGHTTLVTGAVATDHGMIGNIWFDRESGALSDDIEVPENPLLPTRKAPPRACRRTATSLRQ